MQKRESSPKLWTITLLDTFRRLASHSWRLMLNTKEGIVANVLSGRDNLCTKSETRHCCMPKWVAGNQMILSNNKRCRKFKGTQMIARNPQFKTWHVTVLGILAIICESNAERTCFGQWPTRTCSNKVKWASLGLLDGNRCVFCLPI